MCVNFTVYKMSDFRITRVTSELRERRHNYESAVKRRIGQKSSWVDK